MPCFRMVLRMRFAHRLLLFLLVFGEGTVSASFTKFEGLGKYLGNVPIFGKWSFVSALESSSLLKPSSPPSFGDDASATPSLWVKLPAGWEMFIAEYGELGEFGLVLFSADTVSESFTISGIETDSKGHLSVNFETLMLETCHVVGFLCIAEAAAATCDAFPSSFSVETTLDGKTEGKRILKALFLLVCYLCAPQVSCAGHTAAAFFHTALHLESLAAAAKAGAFLFFGLLMIFFCRPIVILQAVVGARFGMIWILSVVCTELFGNSFFRGPGTPVVDSLVAAVRRLVLGLWCEEVTHCASLALCVRLWPLRRCGHVLGLRVGGAPCGASLALCGRPSWPPRILASMMSGVVVLLEARKRPHYASEAEATPRVDVGKSLRHQETKPPGPSKTRIRAQKGGLNKRCFFVTDLSGKTLTMTASLDSSVSSLVHDVSSITGIPVEKFYLVVDGRMLNLDLTLSQAGIGWDVSVRMCFQLKGGVKHEVPGSWTCMLCNMGGCWPVRQNCFRCGAARGSGSSVPSGREKRYPGRGASAPVSNGNPSFRQ